MNLPAEHIIAPPPRFVSVNWPKLWRYRDLFMVFARHDISVRHKVLGVLWAILQPLTTMVIVTFIFNCMAKIESGDGTPYPI